MKIVFKNWSLHKHFRFFLISIFVCFAFFSHTVQAIQTRPRAYLISDDPIGGDCQRIGVWNADTKTCALSGNVDLKIFINSNGVTLNGNSHAAPFGVDITDFSNVTIKNISVQNPDKIGINIWVSSNITLDHIRVTNSAFGIQVQNSTDVTVSNSEISGNSVGVELLESPEPTLINDNVHDNETDFDPPLVTTPTGNDSVLFLPGVEASRLYEDRGIPFCIIECEDQLWEPDLDSDVQKLFLNTDGTSKDPNVYTRESTGVMDEAYAPFGPNVYSSFLNDLKNMKSSGQIADYSAVPYDWRLSLDDILNGGTKTGDIISYIGTSTDPYILSELRRLVQGSKTGRVTIVAHSNGGLLAKALLLRLAQTHDPILNKVDNLILVAVPQLGSPQAIAALLQGFNQGIPFGFKTIFDLPLHNNIARGLAQNASPVYEFLPDANYFKYIPGPVVTFDYLSSDWSSKYTSAISSQLSLDHFLTDSYHRVNATDLDLNIPDQANSLLLSQNESTHLALDDWTPPTTMHVSEVAGWGIPTTLTAINYVQGMDESKGQIGIIPDYSFSIDGDGTVVTPSALWGNGAPSIDRYYVNLSQYDNDNWKLLLLFPRKHYNIFEVPQLSTLVQGIIQADSIDSLPKYISTTTPGIGITTDRLVYSLHSPLTLNMYDDQGNHTGISTTTGQLEEQIPGTYYLDTGSVKYIFTSDLTPSHVSMTGYDTGSFTFNVNQLQGDNPVSSVTFKDIPTTPQTKVTLAIPSDIHSISPMTIVTGSSTLILAPKIDGVVTFPPIYKGEFFGTTTPDLAHTTFKAGSTISIPVQLKDSSGSIVLLNLIPAWPVPQRLTNPAPGYVPAYVQTKKEFYTLDTKNQRYVFNWNTQGMPPGMYRIYATLNDNNTYSTIITLK